MDIIDSIPVADTAGFHLTLEALVEYTPLADTFDDSVDDLAQLAVDIEAGKYLYFCARVSAYKHGVLLAQEYLGCCLYESLQQFHDASDYYADMVDTAIEQARAKLQELTSDNS
jgi:hypothetical protein